MMKSALSDSRAQVSAAAAGDPEPAPRGTLLGDFIGAVLPGNDAALERAVELITRHPQIDYARLMVAPAGGGLDGLMIEAEANGNARAGAYRATAGDAPGSDRSPWATSGLERWSGGSAAMPSALRERGMASGARFPIGDGAPGTLICGSRGATALSPETIDWCRAAATIVQSVLECRRLESELLQVQRAGTVGELASAVVHDFNNVLTGIIGFCAILRSQLPVEHPAQQAAEMIDSLSVGGADLTRQLLDFARRDDGSAQTADVNRIVREVCSLATSTTPSDIEVAVQLEAPLPPVRCEPQLLRQALTNLAFNAADAMPEGGRMVVRTRLVTGELSDGGSDERRAAPGRQVAIDVSDDGTGIAPDVLPRIFEPFFTTKRAGSGTGLGLASVQRIARRYGGRIDVATREGAGSTFTLVLPVAA